MKLLDARAAVIAMCQEFSPSAEFPIPNGLVDFMLFKIAGEAMRAAGVRLPASWMITRFPCLVAETETGECGSKWKIDLPFRPLEIHDAITGVYMSDPIIKQGKSIQLGFVPLDSIHISAGMISPPSRKAPAYILEGDTIFLLGRPDFSGCKVTVHAVVGGLNDKSECDPNINVAIPEGGGNQIIVTAAKEILQFLNVPGDVTEDDENEADQ